VVPVVAAVIIDQNGNDGATVSALMNGVLITWITDPPSSTGMKRMDKQISSTRIQQLDPPRKPRSNGANGHDAITLTAKQIFLRESIERKTFESHKGESNSVEKKSQMSEQGKAGDEETATPAQIACARAHTRPAWRFHKAEYLPLLSLSIKYKYMDIDGWIVQSNSG
jgi:hypothetical protein